VSYTLISLLAATAIACGIAFGLWRLFAGKKARGAPPVHISTAAFVVFGLVTFWIYTAVRMGALVRARAPSAQAGRLTPLFATGYALAAIPVGYWFVSYLILGLGENKIVAELSVATSAVLFYVTTLFFMLATFRALDASERLMSELALFLVIAFPISVSPAIGLDMFLADPDSMAARVGPAICFVLAAIFHIWGTALLTKAYNHEPAAPAAVDAAGTRRELMAIMLTDMSGFSQRMEADEDRAFAQVQEHNILVRAKIASHRGIEVKTTGDGFLVLFKSAVDAVDCAHAIQRALAERSKGLAADDALSIRIGLHIGDVKLTSGDVFGDAVNVTARIEPLSPVGGICMSEDLYGLVRKKIDMTAERVEGVKVKNIAAPLTVYRVSTLS
jgi:class 3 adenylate cyclase